MSCRFGGDVCVTPPEYPEPPDPYFGPGPDPDPDPTPTPGDPGDDDGAGGGGDVGEIDTHTAADLVSAMTRIKAALNSDLMQVGLTAAQKSKIGRLLEGLDKIIDALNSGAQLTDHFLEANLGAAAAEVVGFLVAAGVATLAGSLLSSATLVTTLSIVAGMATETLVNNMIEAAPEYYDDWVSEIPPEDDLIDELCALLNPLGCEGFIPPIVLDLNGDGVELLDTKDSDARLDIDNDGFKEKISWVSPEDGILILDHNGSGSVDDISEFSFARFGPEGSTDLGGLQAFDSNQDNVFDSQDDAFTNSFIWQDKNSNAVQDEGELYELNDFNISGISLVGNEVFTGTNGSVINYDMTFYQETPNGNTTSVAADVSFIGSLNSGVKSYEDDNVVVMVDEQGQKLLKVKSGNTLTLNIGEDEFLGHSDFNVVKAGKGRDEIVVSSDDDIVVSSGKGRDYIEVVSANAEVYGGKGKDVIIGGAGNDKLHGQKGNDIIQGGGGQNYLYGGRGADEFIVGIGQDVIVDFENHRDTIFVEGLNRKALNEALDNAIELETGVKVNFTDDSFLILHGFEIEDLIGTDIVVSE